MRYYPILITLLITIYGFGQNIQEAYQFSNNHTNGTARYTAMAGAFGALGGDISALKDNPAGSSVFLNNYGSATFNAEFFNNEVSLNNFTTNSKENELDLSQLGGVFVFENYNEDATISKFAFALTYDKNKSLNNFYIWQGNNSSSISDYFTGLANGVPLNFFGGNSLDANYQSLAQANFSNLGLTSADVQTAYLGYEAFLFDPLNSEENTYISNVSGNNFRQQYNYVSQGLNAKVSANASMAIKDKLYLGVNLNGHIINQEETTVFFEAIENPSYINEIYFENNILTLGGGFSFDVGAIYRVNNLIRVGASYQSPTWYNIHEETSQVVASDSSQDGFVNVDPRVLNIFPEYNYKTPAKYNTSIAFIFGKKGLVSFDYSYKDYTDIEYSSSSNYFNFDGLNSQIQNNFQSVSTYKIGGEYRLKNWSFRGGFKYEGSPYKDDNVISDATLYSTGLGYDFGNFKIDLAYSRFNQTYQQSFYRSGLQPAEIDNTINNVTATISLNL